MVKKQKKAHEDRTCGINSEGDVYFEPRPGETEWVDEPESAAGREMVALWRHAMGRFRNWQGNRVRGGSFSDTTFVSGGVVRSAACVMPLGYVARSDNRARVWLQLEFAARGNEWFERDDGPEADVLAGTISALVSLLREDFPDLLVYENEDGAGYFTLNVVATGEHFERACEAALMAAEAVESDEVLHSAHEWIA